MEELAKSESLGKGFSGEIIFTLMQEIRVYRRRRRRERAVFQKEETAYAKAQRQEGIGD
jgi:uncharacterized protein YcfJ